MANIEISPITSPTDIKSGFTIATTCFTSQTSDGIWRAMFPRTDTPAGHASGVDRSIARWRDASTKTNKYGDPTTIFLKACVAGEMVGYAIWVHAATDPGVGVVQGGMSPEELEGIYPGDQGEQRYLGQLDRSLHGARRRIVEEEGRGRGRGVMVLDLCVVVPGWQRRGVAGALVGWGLGEAARRSQRLEGDDGVMECVTEASVMGRSVYEKLGFKGQGEIEFVVDEEFRGRSRPSNLSMRTGGG